MFGLKREIEEKTADYTARVAAAQKERTAQIEKGKQRRAEVKAAADAASRKRLIGFKLQYRRALRAWTFNASVNANFLLLSWSDTKGKHSHALNLSPINDISLDVTTSTAPKPTGSAVVFNEHTWTFIPPGQYVDVGMWYGANVSSSWQWELYGESYPSPARDASILFSGIPFSFTVPHDRAQAAYDAILAAIADA